MMAELMSLDIVRPAQPVPVARPGYSAARTFALPSFWRGAVQARVEIYARDASVLNCQGILRAQTIEAKTAAGCPLHEIVEFADWLRAGGSP